jgi:alpha-amylase
VYFVLTDRFVNGDPGNDHSYGRRNDGMQEIGTFHGGDLRGLTSKLDYLQQLGVNALWISAPFEQIHGWVGGGTKGDFPTTLITAITLRTGPRSMRIWVMKLTCVPWLTVRTSAAFVSCSMSS